MSVEQQLKEAKELIARLQEALARLQEEAEYQASLQVDDTVRRLTVELYDIVYEGEDPMEREVRWKWVVLGVRNMKEKLKKLEACPDSPKPWSQTGVIPHTQEQRIAFEEKA